MYYVHHMLNLMISENEKLFFFCVKVMLTIYQVNIKPSCCTVTSFSVAAV